MAAPSAAASGDDECESFLQRLCCGDENLILISGCTPKQKVPLRLGAGEHQIFVDGEPVEGTPGDLSLRADRDHTVFIKRDGYKPTLVVLRSEGEAGSETLQPSTIDLELVKRPDRVERAVEIGVVDEEPAPVPANQPEPPAKAVPPPAGPAGGPEGPATTGD